VGAVNSGSIIHIISFHPESEILKRNDIMLGLWTPHINCLEDPENLSHGTFTMEPLFPGFGTVLGNAMRRVLLSSLPGTAVTSIRISGVQHEFTTIPGIKEDVTDIVLNVKNIVAKLYCEGTKTVHIEAAGEREVTAGDILADGEVEILNPDLHIATLGAGATLSMELSLSHGRGYVFADKNKPTRPVIGIIPVDSSYNPVRKVKYITEEVHAGDVADYDRMALEVWTNGTITAREAVALSGRILRDHLELIADPTMQTISNTSCLKNMPRENSIKKKTISELDLSVRSHNCLRRAGITTVGSLISKTEDEVRKLRGMGEKSFDEILDKITSLGLSLASGED